MSRRKEEAGPAQRLFTACDVEGYSRLSHDDQRAVQHEIKQLHERAMASARMDPASAVVQHRGDGDLIRWSADTTVVTLLGDYIRLLHKELVRINATKAPSHQVRMRMSLVSGVSEPGDCGWAGNGPIIAARLVDSDQARLGLRMAPDRPLVVIIDDNIYQDFVAPRIHYLRPEDYAPVVIELPGKGFHRNAWITAPDCEAAAQSSPQADSLGRNVNRTSPYAVIGGAVLAAGVVASILLLLDPPAGGSAVSPPSQSSIPVQSPSNPPLLAPASSHSVSPGPGSSFTPVLQCSTPPAPFNLSSVRGTITTPKHDDQVAVSFTMSGTLQNIPGNRRPFIVTEIVGPSGHAVWEVLKCATNRVWPVPVPVGQTGNWFTHIALGEAAPKFSGTVYKVTLVMVDESVEKQFLQYIDRADRDKKYPGVATNSFAGVIEEVSSVRLKRL